MCRYQSVLYRGIFCPSNLYPTYFSRFPFLHTLLPLPVISLSHFSLQFFLPSYFLFRSFVIFHIYLCPSFFVFLYVYSSFSYVQSLSFSPYLSSHFFSYHYFLTPTLDFFRLLSHFILGLSFPFTFLFSCFFFLFVTLFSRPTLFPSAFPP